MHFNTAVVTLSILGSALATPFFSRPGDHNDRDERGRDPVDVCLRNFEDCMSDSVRSYGYVCDSRLVACLHGREASNEIDGEDTEDDDSSDDGRGRRGRARNGRDGRGRNDRDRDGRGRRHRGGRLNLNDDLDGDYIPGEDDRNPDEVCGKEHNDGQLIPDHRDCGLFYACSNGKAHHMACPGNLKFNRMLRVCDYPERAQCRERRERDNL